MGLLRLQFAVYRYVEGVSGREEKEWMLTDELEGREWGEQVDGRDFVFFQVKFRFVSRLLGGEVDGVMSGLSLQGLDSPGGDYMVVERGGGDVGRLREACVQTYRCIGEWQEV